MNPAQPDYAFIVTVGFACAVALSIAVVVLMQLRPRLNLHTLRIVWSVGCGIACVLLIVLWVRSYWQYDYLYLGRGRALMSMRGDVHTCSMGGQIPLPRWSVSTTPLVLTGPHTYSFLGIGYSPGAWPPATIPDWLPTLLFVSLAALPWLRWRFRLRTLLIATTLVALMLGLIVYLSAKPPATPPIDNVDVPEF